MWFGVAPAPAPSPRTNTKAWHPPHCTCARHGGASSGRSELAIAVQSPRTARATMRRTAIHSLGELSTGRRQDLGSPTRKVVVHDVATPSLQRQQPQSARKPNSVHQEKGTVVNTLRSIADDATQRVHRLSRRLSRRQSAQGDSLLVDPVSRDNHHYDQPEREERIRGERDSNAVVINDGWPMSESTHPQSRSRAGTAIGFSRPTSSVRPALCPVDGIDRPLNPSSFLPVPAPTQSRRGSRGSQSRHGERSTNGSLRGTASSTTVPSTLRPLHVEGCVHLSPPMVERAQPTNLVGHTSSVGVVLVDDESFVVSCSIDGSVKVWSRRTFDCLYTLYGHDDAVSSVDLSARWLVSGSHDTTLRVYESGHGFRFLHTLEGHSGHVTRVVLLRDSFYHQQHVALSCSDDASLRLWDVEHGHCVAVFKSHASRVTCLLVLSQSTNLFCSGSADASICFWDLTRVANTASDASPSLRGALKTFRVHKATVQCLLSASDHTVVSCSNDGTIQWFDARSCQHLGCVDVVQSPVYSMALHPTLGFLVCSTGDGRLLVYSNLTGSSLAKRELQVSPQWISSLQLLRGQLLACVSDDNLIIVNLERPRIERVLATAHGFLNCVRWLQPEQLVTSGEDNVVKIWSIY